jgi:hypothetical protein
MAVSSSTSWGQDPYWSWSWSNSQAFSIRDAESGAMSWSWGSSTRRFSPWRGGPTWPEQDMPADDRPDQP